MLSRRSGRNGMYRGMLGMAGMVVLVMAAILVLHGIPLQCCPAMQATLSNQSPTGTDVIFPAPPRQRKLPAAFLQPHGAIGFKLADALRAGHAFAIIGRVEILAG